MGSGRGGQQRQGFAAAGSRHRAVGYSGEVMADANYPDDLLYHAEHDWARLEDGHATLGITWYAQDALGEVVFCEPPAVGRRSRRTSPTPRSSPSRPSPT